MGDGAALEPHGERGPPRPVLERHAVELEQRAGGAARRGASLRRQRMAEDLAEAARGRERDPQVDRPPAQLAHGIDEDEGEPQRGDDLAERQPAREDALPAEPSTATTDRTESASRSGPKPSQSAASERAWSRCAADSRSKRARAAASAPRPRSASSPSIASCARPTVAATASWTPPARRSQLRPERHTPIATSTVASAHGRAISGSMTASATSAVGTVSEIGGREAHGVEEVGEGVDVARRARRQLGRREAIAAVLAEAEGVTEQVAAQSGRRPRRRGVLDPVAQRVGERLGRPEDEDGPAPIQTTTRSSPSMPSSTIHPSTTGDSTRTACQPIAEASAAPISPR